MLSEEIEDFLIEVPRWDLTVHNARYVRFHDNSTMIKFLSHPDIKPIKIVDAELGKDVQDVNIGLVSLTRPSISPVTSVYFEQAFDLKLDDIFFMDQFGGFAGTGRPSYTRLMQRISNLKNSLDFDNSINVGYKVILTDEIPGSTESSLKLYLWQTADEQAHENAGLDNCDPANLFNFPGVDQPGEFDKANKLIDLWLKQKASRRRKAREYATSKYPPRPRW